MWYNCRNMWRGHASPLTTRLFLLPGVAPNHAPNPIQRKATRHAPAGSGQKSKSEIQCVGLDSDFARDTPTAQPRARRAVREEGQTCLRRPCRRRQGASADAECKKSWRGTYCARKMAAPARRAFCSLLALTRGVVDEDLLRCLARVLAPSLGADHVISPEAHWATFCVGGTNKRFRAT